MNKNQLSSIITAAIIILAVTASILLKKTDYSHLSLECDKTISDILMQNGINAKEPLRQTQQPVSVFRKKAQLLEKEFIVPQRKTLSEIKNAFLLSEDFAPLVISRIQTRETNEEEILILEFYYKDLKLYRLLLRQKIITAKIAIVLDDWGYSNKLLNKIMELNTPITCAILPRLPYSSEIATALNMQGHEFILHLPLEPYNSENQPLEKDTIFTSMSKEVIEEILEKDFSSVKGLKGANNHMGSKGTESEYVMSLVLEKLKQNNLYFFDSYTTQNSIAKKIAQEKGVTFFKRDVFLDDKNDKEQIKEQLRRTKHIAVSRGYAIAIGHARELTIDAIQEVIPEFEKEGFGFIYLSEIAQIDIDPSLETIPDYGEQMPEESFNE